MNRQKDIQELRELRDEVWSIEARLRGLQCLLLEIINQAQSLSTNIQNRLEKVQKDGGGHTKPKRDTTL